MHKTVTVTRDVEATMIPAGTPVAIPKGTEVTITQALGGTYTVMAPGIMARIEGKNADALGLAVDTGAQKPKTEAAEAAGPVEVDAIWDALKTCYDPEIPVNIVDMVQIYDCHVTPLPEADRFKVEVKMTLTAPGCGMGPVLQQDDSNRLLSIEEVDEADVQLVWDPQWNQGMMTEAAKLQLGLL